MKIVVDDKAGYCFGVRNAIMQAEAMLEEEGGLFSVGHIVHNEEEVKRLALKGLKIINHEEFNNLRNDKVLIRAHGEPPSTYDTAYRNNITLLDATCPIVKHLQKAIGERYLIANETNSQIVIYGKKNHPEVIGLIGQTGGKALVIISETEIEMIDAARHVHLYSQTTMSTEGFNQIADSILKHLENHAPDNRSKLFVHNTICRQVSDRIIHLEKFAAKHHVVLFVSGNESSNGRFLLSVCKKINPQTYHIENEHNIEPEWFAPKINVGITGATSTSIGQLNKIAEYVAGLTL